MDWGVFLLNAEWFVYWCCWFMVVIYAHELGHWFKAKDLNYSARIGLFKCVVTGVVGFNDRVSIARSGVMWGLPFLFIGFGLFSFYWASAMVLIYLVGVKGDLVYIFKKMRSIR